MFILLKVLTYVLLFLAGLQILVKDQIFDIMKTSLPWHISYTMVLSLFPREKMIRKGLRIRSYCTLCT